MDWNEIVSQLTGRLGGVFALGGLLGSIFTFKYIAPKLYGAKISALEEKVAALEKEIEPYREFKEQQAIEAMRKRKL